MIRIVCCTLAAATLALPAPSPRLAAAQSPVLELDHIYIVVPPEAAKASRALGLAGLVVDTSVTRHEGQGTASIAVFFENTYLELLWVDSSVTADSLHRLHLADFIRAATWRQSGASPFGVGLHFLSGTREELGIPVRLDSAAHLRPGTYYVLLRQPAESLAVDMFIMPDYSAVTSWLARYRDRRPDLFAHLMGARRITRAVIRGRPDQRPRAAGVDPRLLRFEDAGDPLLVLEFDGGRRGERWDLRPDLPLILQR